MRFLADENVEPVTVEWLRGQGHDVPSVREAARGSADADLLARANAEGRVVVTYDTDFGELAYRDALPHVGIVLLRLSDARAVDRLARLRDHWPVIASRCEGHFIVVGDDRVRIRPVSPPP